MEDGFKTNNLRKREFERMEMSSSARYNLTSLINPVRKLFNLNPFS